MRDIDKQDVPALGKKVEKPPMPEQHRKVNGKEGVYKAPDGKLYTQKPENEAAHTANPWRNYPFIFFFGPHE